VHGHVEYFDEGGDLIKTETWKNGKARWKYWF
jgi:antitoxin component YwqK of YwqJK toxin-antitoxin module